jgi:hypothetical protein
MRGRKQRIPVNVKRKRSAPVMTDRYPRKRFQRRDDGRRFKSENFMVVLDRRRAGSLDRSNV